MKEGFIMGLLRAYAGFPLSTKLEPKNVQIVKTYVIMEEYIGWGLHFVQRGEYIQLVSLTPGSYAQRNAILQPGDVLFKVGKAKLLGYRLLHISSMLNAIKTGTVISVTVYRNFIPLLGQWTTNTTAAVAAPDAGNATRATMCPWYMESHHPLVKVSPRKLPMQTIGTSAHSNVVLHGNTCADHNKKEQLKKYLQEEHQPHQQKQKNKEDATTTAVSTTTNVTAAAPDNGLTIRASTCPQARQSHNSLMKMSPGKLYMQTIGPSTYSKVVRHRKTCVNHIKKEQLKKDMQEQQPPHQLRQKKTIQLEFMRVGYERTLEVEIPESSVGSTRGTCLGQKVEKEAVTAQSRKKEVLSDKEDATTTAVSTASTTTNVTAAARDKDPAIRASTCPHPREFHDSLIKMSPGKLYMQTIGPSTYSNVVRHRKTCVDHIKNEQLKKDLQEQQQPHQLKQKKTIQLEFMRVGYERTLEVEIPESSVGSTRVTCFGQKVEKEAVTAQSQKKEVLSDKEDATMTAVSTTSTTTNVTAAARDKDLAIRACTCPHPREFHDSLIMMPAGKLHTPTSWWTLQSHLLYKSSRAVLEQQELKEYAQEQYHQQQQERIQRSSLRQEPARERAQGSVLERAQEPVQEHIQRSSLRQERAKELAQERAQELAQERAQELAQERPQEPAQEPVQEHIQRSSLRQERAKEPAQERAQEPAQEPPQEPAQEPIAAKIHKKRGLWKRLRTFFRF